MHLCGVKFIRLNMFRFVLTEGKTMGGFLVVVAAAAAA